MAILLNLFNWVTQVDQQCIISLFLYCLLLRLSFSTNWVTRVDQLCIMSLFLYCLLLPLSFSTNWVTQVDQLCIVGHTSRSAVHHVAVFILTSFTTFL